MKLIVKEKKRKAKSKQKAKNKWQCFKSILLYSMMLCSLLFALYGCATTGNVKETTLPEGIPVITGIDIQDYSVTIKVSKPFSYTMYRPEDPYKVVVELLDVNTGAFNMKIISDKAGITEIVPYQIESPFMTRLEILLQTPTTAEPEYKDNALKIRIKESPKEVTKAEIMKAKEEVSEIKEAEPVIPEKKELPKATEITTISFEKSDDIVNVLFKGNGSMNPDVLPLDNRIVIDVPDVDMKAQIPESVVPPLKSIRSGKHDNKIRLVLDLKENTDFDVTTIGDTLVVALSTLSMPVSQKPEGKVEAVESVPGSEDKYTGKKISLDFQDADIVPIFRLLSDISGYNIVVSPEVKGKLTMKLINVPWDQALDIILKTFSLGKTVENNIIRIAPHTAFTRESEEAAKAKESEVRAFPLETKLFHINYADVSNIEKSIKDAKILSSRGSISVDKRTSSLAVNDVAAVFPQIENLLSTLDTPTPQVMIEARLVEVNTSDVNALGIQWGVTHEAGSKPFTGNVNLGKLITSSGAFTGKNFMVDFPASGVGAGAGAGFAIGILDPTRTMGLDLQLSALERLEKSRIISNPRVVTTDNEKASIMQGTSVPFPKVDVQSGQISVEYKDVVILIEVTPHITPSGAVTTLIFVKKEDIIRETSIGGNPVPVTSKIEGNTKVLVQTGETIVIGGLLKKTEKENTSGVPGLMNIPILGWLFKSKGTTEETTELLIFITPRVLEQKT
jgi:type IV pilus assembly protein PilQ